MAVSSSTRKLPSLSAALVVSLLVVLRAKVWALPSDNVNLRPRQQINAEQMGRRFMGQSLATGSTESDYFKLLERDGSSLMVGARDAVYNLSLATLEVQQHLVWAPPAKTIEDCLMKGKTKVDCHNYVRVMVQQANGRSLICGTNAFAPKCREYQYSPDDESYRERREFDGQAITPYDPRDNSTAVYLPHTNEIYAGTVSDFAGNDPLIYRKSLSDSGVDLRTQRDDVRVLESPNFVSSFADGEHVYFWYRETAAESVDDGGQRVYARVARVCKSDRGGPRPSSDRWTSFVKARLNCSLPGNAPFYFDELQATSEPVTISDGSSVVYAVFTTPQSAVRMSAVCAFRMDDIRRLFDTGDFKVQKAVNSLWSPLRAYELPKPRPGSCVPESTRLPEQVTAFVTRNPLMYDAVPNMLPRPLVIEGADRAELTQITVAPQINTVSGRRHDVLFVGTADGKVLKLVDSGAGKATLIEAVRVFDRLEPVVNLLTSDRQLIVVSRDQVAGMPLYHCGEQRSCSSCVRLQDPYCAWDLSSSHCVGRSEGEWTSGNFVQNIAIGKSEQCPEGAIDPELYAVDELYPQQVAQDSSRSGVYSAQSLAVAVVVTLAVASTIGFLIGYRLSRWRFAQDHPAGSMSSGSDYDAHSYGRSRLTRHDSLGTAANAKIISDHVYGSSPKMDAVSLVLTLPPGSVGGCSGMTTPKTEKNLLATLNNGTLPKDYKVKKVYL